MKDAREKGRPVYTWTVNNEDKMRWTIREGLDGVCTDNPKRFLEICDDWEQGHREIHLSTKDWLMTIWTQLMIFLFGAIFWWKYGGLDRQESSKSGTKEAGQGSRQTKPKKLQKMPMK